MALIILSLLLTGRIHGQTLNFDGDKGCNWQKKDFNGRNEFSVKDGILHVISRDSASVYYCKLALPVTEPFTLWWSWKTNHLLSTGDPSLKQNDDYAARVYLVFRSGPFPWQVRSINYVLTGHPAGKTRFWMSPYSRNAAMIPTGATFVPGVWQHHQAKPVDDFERIFQQKPGDLIGIAVMSDTDDTGLAVQAWYKEIQLCRQADGGC